MRFLLILFASVLTFPAIALQDVSVVISISREDQSIERGYNIVDEVCRYVEEEVKGGRLLLWDSPNKKYRLGKDDLANLENTSKTHLRVANRIYLHEKWNGKKDKLRWTVLGISLLNDTRSGEPLLYGYLELKNDLRNKLDSAYMRTNANASSGITFWKAINSHAYRFDILFFGDKPVSDYNRSETIKRKTFYHTGDKLRVPEIRLVRYSLEPGASPLTIRTGQVINHFDTFFNQNPQELLNHGADSFLDFLQFRSVVVTKVEILEQWQRQGKSIIRTVVSIEPYLFGRKASSIPFEEFAKWGVEAEGRLLSDILMNDELYRRVISINTTPVTPAQSDAAWSQLFTDTWPTLHSDLTP